MTARRPTPRAAARAAARAVVRKAPRQDRSRVLVESLLEAAARILVQGGWDALTTNRVAAEAGVSVGSLYQYFPHKEALVAALIERLSEDMARTLTELARSLEGRPVDESISRIVAGAIEVTRRDAGLHRAVMRELPRIGGREVYERMRRRLTDALADWIASQRDVLDVEDPTLTAYTIVTALDALTDDALHHRPELLESPRFARSLEAIVAGALGASRSAE